MLAPATFESMTACPANTTFAYLENAYPSGAGCWAPCVAGTNVFVSAQFYSVPVIQYCSPCPAGATGLTTSDNKPAQSCMCPTGSRCARVSGMAGRLPSSAITLAAAPRRAALRPLGLA
jgi:hypothetical protein